MDAVGKWSLLEFIFVILLLLMFNLSVGSPEAVFLPEEDLYFLSVRVAPQSSFYVFTAAVLISLVLSNLMVSFHEKIIHKSEKMVLKDSKSVVYHNACALGCCFTPAKTLNKVKLGGITLAIALNLLMLIFGIFTDILEINYLGMVALLLRIEGTPSTTYFSIFSIGQAVFARSITEADAGYFFMGIVYIITQIVIPFIVVFITLHLMFGSFTLESARRWQRIHSLVQAWSTVEVFTLAIIIAVIEIQDIAKELKTKECDLFKPFFQDILLPVGLVSQEDVEATCFGINLQLRQGAYVLVFVAFVSALITAVITVIFASAIEEHLSNMQEISQMKNLTQESKAKVIVKDETDPSHQIDLV